MGEFTLEEQKVLSRFVTNTDRDIFALFNLPEVVKGALFSRYSRSSKSLRRVLLDEFLLNKEQGFAQITEHQQERGASGLVATQKAEEFYERVLVGYGDDSVAELAGAHVAMENISNIATKFIEDSRIGLSPLEKSTRYVYFDQKDMEGRYRFCREPGIMNSEFSESYEKTCNLLFDTYASLIPKVSKFFMERFPKTQELSDRAYSATIRAKTCDILRGLLPASTLTNMGAFGNGRGFEYLLTKMYASDLAEIRNIASALHSELRLVIPAFVKRTDDKYGKQHIAYISNTDSAVAGMVSELVKNEKNNFETAVGLADYDSDAELKVLAAMIHSNSQLSMKRAREIAKSLPKDKAQSLLSAYIGERQNRRHKPYRAFENTYYTFDICANFGAYRDIHRHRVLTQQRQLLNTSLGYDMPKELAEAGYENEFKNAMEAAENAYERIAKKMPGQAQYVVPLAYRLRWYMKMNLREAYHFCELRSVQQGHPDYRKIAQEMYMKIKEVHPSLASGMKFVDMNSYALERLDSEKRIDKKLEEIDKKYAKGPPPS
ncbi:MAG: FAD-dependent thymidylate synthase [Candidatus ainarchaeum sp.]|nr:FAD-dependent thymidylate synthase [Candidatus ainarchaeum sp.]